MAAGAPDAAMEAKARGWPGAGGGPGLAFPRLATQAELVRSGGVSARELVELSLQRIEATQPTLNVFRVICAEDALAAADRADMRGRDADGGGSAPLLGVPVAVKEEVRVPGH